VADGKLGLGVGVDVKVTREGLSLGEIRRRKDMYARNDRERSRCYKRKYEDRRVEMRIYLYPSNPRYRNARGCLGLSLRTSAV
jgi:hypothetical protein